MNLSLPYSLGILMVLSENVGCYTSCTGLFFKFPFIECGEALSAAPTMTGIVSVFTPHILAISAFYPLLWLSGVFFPPVRILQLIYTIFSHYASGWYMICWLVQIYQCGFVDHTELCMVPLSCLVLECYCTIPWLVHPFSVKCNWQVWHIYSWGTLKIAFS